MKNFFEETFHIRTRKLSDGSEVAQIIICLDDEGTCTALDCTSPGTAFELLRTLQKTVVDAYATTFN